MLSLLLKILKVLNLGAFMSAKCDLIPHQTVNTVKYFTQILGQPPLHQTVKFSFQRQDFFGDVQSGSNCFHFFVSIQLYNLGEFKLKSFTSSGDFCKICIFLHNLVVGKPTITSGKLILRYLAVDIALLNLVRFFHLGVLNH